MSIKMKLILGIIFIMTESSVAIALPLIGFHAAGQISTYSEAGARVFPLPKGSWKVIYSNQSSKLANGEVNTISGSNKIDTVYLIQSDLSPSPFILGIQYNITNRFPRYLDTLCKAESPYYSNSYGSAMWNQKCLEVGYVSNIAMFEGWPDSRQAKSSFVKEGMKRPQGYLEMTFTQYSIKGDWLQVRFLVNPEDYGFSGGDGSQWEKDMISSSVKNKQFLDEFVSFAKTYADRLSVSFMGQSSSLISEFMPSSAYVGGARSSQKVNTNNSSVNSMLDTSNEEVICRDIGLKPKSESFASCVLQLLQKKGK